MTSNKKIAKVNFSTEILDVDVRDFINEKVISVHFHIFSEKVDRKLNLKVSKKGQMIVYN